MLSELLVTVGIGLVAYIFYKWATHNNDYFVKRDLPFKKPTFLLGNSGSFYFSRSTAVELMQKIYNRFPNAKMYGSFNFRQPTLIVRDPTLLKHLTVKVFDHFEDHLTLIDVPEEELSGGSLFMMKGQAWRDMRATLSPAFTGSKMRQMFELVTECADEMTKHFLKLTSAGEKIDFEMKNLFSRYTNDVIATCAFGLRVNSFKNPENEFFVTGQKFQSFSFWQVLKLLLTIAMPRLVKKLKIEVVSSTVNTFFEKMVSDTMEERKKRGIIRPDMINILMQVRRGEVTENMAKEQVGTIAEGSVTIEETELSRKSSHRKWTDKEIAATCLVFFIAGFDTISTALTFLTYELCVDLDIQQKLYEEIAETERSLGGKRIDYDTLLKLKYLDQVISETLRKWPPAILTDRACVKEYVCEYEENRTFRFEKGIVFSVPIYGLHHDPKYFPNPNKFDPERFSDENKRNIVPGSYLPFGIGPRNCIGSRFALMELKAVVYYILLNFSLVPNAKSQIPIQLVKSPFGLRTEGWYLDFVPRHQQ